MAQPQPIRAALAAFLGTAIEWYDYYIYGTAAALVFGEVFFATNDPFMGVLASLATFAVGFVARPFGALVFGHLGDKVGRKKSLVITLVLMGSATTAIGLLPSFHSIGVTATILLVILRLAQGVAVGGEWGGAVLIATEHAPEKWRTFLAAAPQYGSPVGLILSTLAFRAVSSLPQEDFAAWGWRIPFILSGLLVIVAFIIRAGVNESPEMVAQLERDRSYEMVPVREVLKTKKKAVVLGVGLSLLGIAGFYFITTFMISYTTTYLKIPKSQILDVISWIGVVQLFATATGSYIASKIGERLLLLIATGGAVIWSVPMMMLVITGNISNIAAGVLVATFMIGMYYAVIAAYLPRAFPVRMRYTGISLSFQLCGAIFGGTTPIVGVWLAHTYGLQWGPLAALFAVIAGGAFLSIYFLPIEKAETAAEVGSAAGQPSYAANR